MLILNARLHMFVYPPFHDLQLVQEEGIRTALEWNLTKSFKPVLSNKAVPSGIFYCYLFPLNCLLCCIKKGDKKKVLLHELGRFTRNHPNHFPILDVVYTLMLLPVIILLTLLSGMVVRKERNV